eukprot:CAMPEP_0184688850 /NCGR_PEP_ID=MMETSP0312-20130426/30322_1 /TAXON_ID=31354 /ORGANISM="Compsopogon coeruleus, Strain SAG 36.94" /LENGTH=277 /DNA_ID=CAMNT_0027146121 /DNA_START=377 /DNA_END=1210 /DNA_ORIENTATION=-
MEGLGLEESFSEEDVFEFKVMHPPSIHNRKHTTMKRKRGAQCPKFSQETSSQHPQFNLDNVPGFHPVATESDILSKITIPRKRAKSTLVDRLTNSLTERCDMARHRRSESVKTSQCWLPDPLDSISIFYSREKPDFPLKLYVQRLLYYIDVSESVFYAALIYLDRLLERHPTILVDEHNVHRFLITSVVLASKFLEDNVYTNRHYARAGGLASTTEMNMLEAEMLRMIRFDLYLSLETYGEALGQLKVQEISVSAKALERLEPPQASPTAIQASTSS